MMTADNHLVNKPGRSTFRILLIVSLLVLGGSIIKEAVHVFKVPHLVSGREHIISRLPGGTRVSMMPDADLRYEASTAGDTERDIWIAGEAVFELNRQVESDYVIHTPSADIVTQAGKLHLTSTPDSTVIINLSGTHRAKSGIDNRIKEVKILPGDSLTIVRGADLNK